MESVIRDMLYHAEEREDYDTLMFAVRLIDELQTAKSADVEGWAEIGRRLAEEFKPGSYVHDMGELKRFLN